MTEHTFEDVLRDIDGMMQVSVQVRERIYSGEAKVDGIQEWHAQLWQSLGYQQEDLNKLRAIHVTGTKGKGSVCIMAEAVLLAAGQRAGRPLRIGMLTSPHLVCVTERIRINGQPIDRAQYTRYFYQCLERLRANSISRFGFTMFSTLMAFHVFLQENVDVAIVEVNAGGEYDMTNIIPIPAVCGITPIGLDHCALLGNTIAKIAWQKAGIIKEGVPVVVAATKQPYDAYRVIVERATERHATICPPTPLSEYTTNSNAGTTLKLGLAGQHQRDNAAISIELCRQWWQHRYRQPLFDPPCLPDWLQSALQQVSWPGRAQQISVRPGEHWYLDGAHTQESLQICVDWFLEEMHRIPPATTQHRILVFNCIGQRQPEQLLLLLMTVHAQYPFDEVLFCPYYATQQEKECQVLDKQQRQSEVWRNLTTERGLPEATVLVQASVGDAVAHVKAASQRYNNTVILATGSLRLIGEVLTELAPEQTGTC